MTRKPFGTVSLPMPLCVSIDKYIKNTGWHSRSEFVAATMRDAITPDNITLKQKLKALGYNG